MSAQKITSGGICTYGDGLTWEYINKDENDFLFHEIFIANSYIQYGIDICDGDVIVDLGANIGLFSLYCQSIAEDVHIVAVEPLQPIFEVLRRNLLTIENTLLVHGAVGNPPVMGSSELFLYNQQCPGESTRNLTEWRDMQSILNVSIKNLPDDTVLPSRNVSRDEETLCSSFSCPIYSLTEIIRTANLSCIDLLKVRPWIYIYTSNNAHILCSRW